MASFSYLLRFKDNEDRIRYGEAAGVINSESEILGRSIDVYNGEPRDQDFVLSGGKAVVATILCPLSSTPIIHGVGLATRPMLQKAILNHHPIRYYFQSLRGELCVVIGKDCKNLSHSDDPLSYVLGYAVGNDVSSRYWQDKVRSSGQHGYGKSMDKFAPLGPVLVAPHVIGNPATLEIATHVNGERRQASSTKNMIFDIATLIRHLSRGRTLRKGTVIMTGTPDGVAAFMQPSPWLKDGEVVEIEISGIGKISNKMVFEEQNSKPSDDRPPGF